MNDKKRKLAAILFADIVGYTALMQKDEQEASKLLQHFQQQLEGQVTAHNGRIVNFYGDGALCTFQIPIDAVRCGMALQTTFRRAPKTPVRIGIHSGTVTLEGDKIFGDSVNITSRIESMGVAGGVLLSKKVRNEVKNNPDLEMQSLGLFEFKNVEEPMEVFALVNEGLIIPDKEQINKNIKGKKAPTYLQKLLRILPFISIVLIGMLWFFSKNGTAKNSLPQNIKESYVAVLPFKNNTGKTEKAIIGEMISDWLTSGLHETGEGKILSIGEVNRIVEMSQVQKAGLSETTFQHPDVHHLIEGAYYESDSSLFISSHVKNLKTGEIVFSFPIIEGTVSKPTECIEQLKQRILGYWVTKDKVGYERRPPVYEAYKAYLDSEKFWYPNPPKAERLLLKAMELDSNFHYATFGYINMLINLRQRKKADSIITAYEQKKRTIDFNGV